MKYLIDSSTMTSLADAIRSKAGTSSSLTTSAMIDTINNLDVGGSGVAGVVNTFEYQNSSTITSFENSTISAVLMGGFENCYRLESVSLPNCVYIGKNAFFYDSQLNNISFPNCGFIDDHAFYDCSSLTQLSFPLCSYIGSNAFGLCSGLQGIVSFPVCQTISLSAFTNCQSITTMYFPQLTGIGSYAFWQCISLSSISLPRCSYISASAFYACFSLKKISLPNVQAIGNYAFQHCSSLSAIYLGYSEVVALNNSSAFYKTAIYNGTGYIYVPKSLYSSYITNHTWSIISNMISSYTP